MRIVFLGSAEFACPAFEALLAAGHQIPLAIAQPDRPQGRHGANAPCPLAERARTRGVELFQPAGINTPEVRERIARARPEVLLVIAYGQFLGRALRELAPLGAINLHASLLPRHRGAAPIHEAIRQGDQLTGVTLMRVEREMDAGAILAQRELAIRPLERTGELSARLAGMGAALLVDALPRLAAGELIPRPQDGARASFAPQLRKEDGRIDWGKSAAQVAAHVHAMHPWPMAHTFLLTCRARPVRCNLLRVKPIDAVAGGGGRPLPGLIDPEVPSRVATASGAVEILEIQPSGRRAMDFASFLRGRKPLWGFPLQAGDRFGTPC